jgi:hypothetical protein
MHLENEKRIREKEREERAKYKYFMSGDTLIYTGGEKYEEGNKYENEEKKKWNREKIQKRWMRGDGMR